MAGVWRVPHAPGEGDKSHRLRTFVHSRRSIVLQVCRTPAVQARNGMLEQAMMKIMVVMKEDMMMVITMMIVLMAFVRHTSMAQRLVTHTMATNACISS